MTDLATIPAKAGPNEGKEWMDLRTLQIYASVSERTLRTWIHKPVNPLPAARVGKKILIRKSAFDNWMEDHQVRDQVKDVDIGCIVDELMSGVTR